jgi:hypothetical protein
MPLHFLPSTRAFIPSKLALLGCTLLVLSGNTAAFERPAGLLGEFVGDGIAVAHANEELEAGVLAEL